MATISEQLDVTGHKCPIPILRVRRILERMPGGAILRVLATDPMTRVDFPHFCQESGHELLEMTEEDGIFVFLIIKTGE
ncbi:hypothetical protein MNBD_ALPHA01-1271 [hydrothermal vent metagenome]|uniref:UPF0033 domain-containing protein n=1 Tax=hydrothermal vent metagenome TaxID=652676 RepID=A0A3B0SQQ1_9ZZZZ